MTDICKARVVRSRKHRQLRRARWLAMFELHVIASWPRDIIGFTWALMLACMPVGLVVLAIYATGNRQRATANPTKDAS